MEEGGQYFCTPFLLDIWNKKVNKINYFKCLFVISRKAKDV